MAVRLGALPGAIGMTAAQIAQGATIGQIAVTAVCASLFLATMWLIARGAPIPAGSAGAPCREPLKMVPIGLSIVAVAWPSSDHRTEDRIMAARLNIQRTGDGGVEQLQLKPGNNKLRVEIGRAHV